MEKLVDIFEMFKNLKRKTSKLIIRNIEFTEQFKDKLIDIYKSDDKKIYFNDGTFIIESKDGTRAYLPNQNIYYTNLVMPYVRELERFRDVTIGLYTEKGKTNEVLKKEVDEIHSNKEKKEKKWSDLESEGSPLVAKVNSIDNRSAEEIEYLKRFLTDYKSWGGGKSITRGDAIVSAMYRVLNMVQSQSSVHTIVSLFSKYPDLLTSTDEMFNNMRIGLGKEEMLNYKSNYSFQLAGLTRNQIFYGAPGTGKSHEVKSIIKEEDSDPNTLEQRVFRQTLYADFSYNDFIGQILPSKHGESITYEFTPMVFTRALKAAHTFHSENRRVYLILEEMSRANVAAVFGDIFQLLDRSDGISEYSISNSLISEYVYGKGHENEPIYLPENLFIIGTVNTSDQNVFTMDTAFKRRFDWKYISPKPANDLNNPKLNIITPSGSESVRWHDFYQNLNDIITQDLELGEDKQIGQFFIKFPENASQSEINNTIKNKLLQYLWDDVNFTSLTGKKLFLNQVTSFSKLYDMFDHETIFNTDFLHTLIVPRKG